MADSSQHFLELVYILHASAMQAMGKFKNPVTDKVERNLEQASQSIDMLIMLRDKTSGNLSSQENSVISAMISELQLNFVDESNKDKNGTIN
ncbi:MAG TPA: DUF1844 domain-containing protein [Bacteroidia bacterium]|nr:DUF1844 domain-containing protein [Bacteroidia bacterium]